MIQAISLTCLCREHRYYRYDSVATPEPNTGRRSSVDRGGGCAGQGEAGRLRINQRAPPDALRRLDVRDMPGSERCPPAASVGAEISLSRSQKPSHHWKHLKGPMINFSDPPRLSISVIVRRAVGRSPLCDGRLHLETFGGARPFSRGVHRPRFASKHP